jgi:hypothetical protein
MVNDSNFLPNPMPAIRQRAIGNKGAFNFMAAKLLFFSGLF